MGGLAFQERWHLWCALVPWPMSHHYIGVLSNGHCLLAHRNTKFMGMTNACLNV